MGERAGNIDWAIDRSIEPAAEVGAMAVAEASDGGGEAGGGGEGGEAAAAARVAAEGGGDSRWR